MGNTQKSRQAGSRALAQAEVPALVTSQQVSLRKIQLVPVLVSSSAQLVTPKVLIFGLDQHRAEARQKHAQIWKEKESASCFKIQKRVKLPLVHNINFLSNWSKYARIPCNATAWHVLLSRLHFSSTFSSFIFCLPCNKSCSFSKCDQSRRCSCCRSPDLSLLDHSGTLCSRCHAHPHRKPAAFHFRH